MDRVQLPQGYRTTSRRQFTLYFRPRIDERQSRLLSHPNCESSAFANLCTLGSGGTTWMQTDPHLLVLKPVSVSEISACLKVVSATFLPVCFLSLKESTCETRKNVFYFTSKALFVHEKIKF